MLTATETAVVTDEKTWPAWMTSLAFVVEAAGSVTRASRVGMLNPEGSDALESIKWFVPVSRGGFNARLDADEEWASLVSKALEHRGHEALQRMQKKIDAIEQNGQMLRGGPIPMFGV